MKKIFVLLFLLIATIGAAQNGISYQAVLLNPNGEQLPGADNSKIPLVNSSICLRFSIAASLGGTPEYQETITTRTDTFGMVNVTIGTGNPTPGSPSFSTISWGTGPKNLKVELDLTGLCTSFITVSDQPFTSVPFALYALNSGSGGGSSTTTLTGDVSGTGTGTIATSIANNAVTTTKIADSNVTNAKLQNSSITINGNTVPLGGTATINTSPIGTALTSGNVLVGSASNLAAEVTMNGDVTITNTGVTAIGTGKVTDTKLDKTNIPLSGFGAAVAAVDLGSNKLTNVTDPTLAQDAATKNYVDAATGAITNLTNGNVYIGNSSNVATSVPVSGDVTITNAGVTAIGTGKVTDDKLDKTNIPLSGFGVAVAAVDLGSNKLTNVTDPTLAQDAATKNYVDSATSAITNLTNGNVYVGNSSNVATAVPVTGDVTITNAGVTAIGIGKVTDAKLDKTNIPLSGFGAAVAAVDLGSNKLTNVTDPTLAQDAATKNYVDSATSAITNLTNGNVYIGNSSNVATSVPVTGDVTITNAGVTAIGTGKVTNGKLDKTNIPLSGFSAAVADVDLGTKKLIGVANPTLAQDAATKNYVDAATGAITNLTNGNVYIGNSSNVATAVPVTGDVTITNTGVTAIGTGKVTDGKLDKTNIPLSGFGAAVAAVDLGSNKLTNVTDPILAQDAATKNYVDVATGAITTLADGKIYIGNTSNVATEVTMNGDVTISNTGVTAIGTGKVTDGKLDKTNIPLSGFGAAVEAVDLGSNKLTNVTDPTLAQDAATKNYVDSATSAITNLTNGNVYIGNSSNVATSVPVTGDVTITNVGVTAIGTGKVTDAKLDKINIPLSGFGAAVADVDLGTKKLIGVANPTLAQDAATKSYVDAKIVDGITNTVTTSAPTQNAVYNALTLKEDVANKSSDVTLSDVSGDKYPTELAVKTFVETKVVDNITSGITSSAPTQNAVFNALTLKEDVANKSSDVTLSDVSGDKYPTELAVKTFVETKVIDNITSGITSSAPTQKAVFNALTLKEDVANKSSDVNLSDVSGDKYPTELAVKTFVETKVVDNITSGITSSAPTQKAVFNALALKAPLASPNFTGTITLTGTGNTTLGGKLDVAGTTSLGSALDVYGNLTVNSTKFKVVASSGETTVGGKLNVKEIVNIISVINTTGDNNITINSISGRFKIPNLSNTTTPPFSLRINNNYVKPDSIILCTMTNNNIDNDYFIQSVDAGSDFFTVTLSAFMTASQNISINFLVIN